MSTDSACETGGLVSGGSGWIVSFDLLQRAGCRA
jgi:hypothetical protein